jgi:GGDEF domain-containing protein
MPGELVRIEIARRSDAIARVGGGEFALLLLQTDRDAANALGDRIAARLKTARVGGHARPAGVLPYRYVTVDSARQRGADGSD